jgi:hypothetical protein
MTIIKYDVIFEVEKIFNYDITCQLNARTLFPEEGLWRRRDGYKWAV